MAKQRVLHISLVEVSKAKAELSKYLRPTPLLLNAWLSDALECDLYLKMENMQPIGSFKIRGATYKISKLSSSERRRGVIAASAGNHAQGVAWGARQLGADALIVMPRTGSIVKYQNTKMLGAEVLLEGDNFEQAFEYARKMARKTGRVFIHAFEDEAVIAGQGTVGLEIIDQLPDADYVVGSIGGGGLMAGVATVLSEMNPKIQMIGCQAAGASSMVRSLRAGKVVATERCETFADGVAVARASPAMLKLLAPKLDGFLYADDEAIAAAVLTLLEKAKIVAEGSGALPLAAVEKMKSKIRGKKVILILSGGNIDVNVLSRIIDRGLIRAGRRVRLNVMISDRPGSLAKLTELIAREGASVLQAIHDRNEPSTEIDQTDVALTLETRGPEHSRAVVRALKKSVLRLDLVH